MYTAQYLKVKDSSILLMEALAMRHHPMQQGFIQGEARNGCQQPTISYNQYIEKKLKSVVKQMGNMLHCCFSNVITGKKHVLSCELIGRKASMPCF